MARAYFPAAIVARAYEVQAVAFTAGLSGSVAFIAFALATEERFAMAAAIIASTCYGAAAGAWIVAERFKD